MDIVKVIVKKIKSIVKIELQRNIRKVKEEKERERVRDRGREEEKNREGEREEIKKEKEKYVLLKIFYFVEFCTKMTDL